jgi:hypothetical protein
MRQNCPMFRKSTDPPLLLPHLTDGISYIKCADLLIILELEELIPAMSSEVEEDIGGCI